MQKFQRKQEREKLKKLESILSQQKKESVKSDGKSSDAQPSERKKEPEEKEKANEASDREGLLKKSLLKKQRFKMKLERLILFNNEQNEDGLKHIYTLLISNPTLLIEIDLPKLEDRICLIETESSHESDPGRQNGDIN